MTDTSLAANLDALALRLQDDIVGLKAVFTITGTEADDGTLIAIPPSLASTPVGVLWFQGENTDAGNEESSVDNVDLLIFEAGTGDGYGYTVLLPYIDAVRLLLRTNLYLDGHATRVLYKGAGAIYPQTMDNQQVYLVLPIHIEILRLVHTDAYSET